MIRIFKSSVIRELLDPSDLANLVKDFKKYKAEGMQPDTFGRDALYDHPHSLPSIRQEEVRHIHLQDESAHWSVRTIQYYRTSDTHLVYCQGAMHDARFLLITLLKPDAHNQARNNNIMMAIAMQAARFREKN